MTETQYKAKLDKLKRLCPKHELIKTLDKGYSTMNSLYLQTALDNIVITQTTNEIEEKATKQTAVAGEKELLNKLLAQKYHFRNKMNRLSNEFHVKKTVEERKYISIQLNDIEKQFIAVKKQIDFFDENGYFKDVSEKITLYTEKDYVVPETQEECLKALNVAKVSISRFEKKLNELASKEFSAKNETKKIEIDKVLLIWKERKLKIQNKINEIKSHSE